MSDAETAEGKRWAESKVHEVARGLDLDLSELRWGQADDDFTRGMESLAFTIGGKRHVMKFSNESLEDAPNDSSVRQRLEADITQSLKAASTPA